MGSNGLIEKMSGEDIKSAVSGEFGKVATDPFGVHPFPVGTAFALKVGYPKEILDELPKCISESFSGAGNPQPFVKIKEGDVILELGCGAGLDIFFYSRAVGSKGRIYALDISKEMVEKARENRKKIGAGNVEITQGYSDDIPFSRNFFDLVASNGIYNLSPDKKVAIKEVFRVLKPGGKMVFSEIVMEKPLSAKTMKEWLKCTGGAISEDDFVALLEGTGFERIKVLSRDQNPRTWHPLATCNTFEAYKPK